MKKGLFPKSLSNGEISELLALASEHAESPLAAKALRRAARSALCWAREARELYQNEIPFTELTGVGPYINRIMYAWFVDSAVAPPRSETRSDFLTLTEARSVLAKNPDWKTSYQGDLQMHTTWSDGSASIEEMAESAFARGYSFIGITDHSKGLTIANGVSEQRLALQIAEITALNEKFRNEGRPFTILKSVELNLNIKGQGDMDPSMLAQLDLVVGAFHSGLRKTDDQTSRYLAALENSSVHILGHPRGRIFNYRLGLTANWKLVFERAAVLGKAVEVDSFPDRQDLNVELLKVARDAGVLIAIDTDAHHPWQLDFVEFGLGAVAKAGIDPDRVINFRRAHELKRLFKNPPDGNRDQILFPTEKPITMALPKKRTSSGPRRSRAKLEAAEKGKSISSDAKEIAKELIAPSRRSTSTVAVAKPPATTKIKELRAAAKNCQACPLYETGTQTVFGEGAGRARIMLVGEQPGDKEDRLGKPFVGPAGQLLNRALEEAGVHRADCYVTNGVKHFKWEPDGKRRLHKKPNSREIAACRPWLLSEIEAIRPDVIVCLGVTAARSVLQRLVNIGRERGAFIDSPFGAKVLVTAHPSSLLRIQNELDKMRAWKAFISDLLMVRSVSREKDNCKRGSTHGTR